MTKEQKEGFAFFKCVIEAEQEMGNKKAAEALERACRSVLEVGAENRRHEKFTRWLIGELIKGELDEESVMNKLVEFGFAECDKGYITVKVEI